MTLSVPQISGRLLVPIFACALIAGSPLQGSVQADAPERAAPALPTEAATADADAFRLSHDAVPTSQSVHLTLDPEQTGYTGTTTVTLKAGRPIKAFRFHARAMTFDSVTVRGPSGPVRVASVDRLDNEQVRLRFTAEAPAGAYTLMIRFHNQFNTKSLALYRVVTDGRGYLFTQLEDDEAREAFPCWDEPCFKIPWTIRLTVPANDLALSNTPIERTTRAGKTQTIDFERTPPLPSYLIAVAVGPFETVPITGLSVPGRIVTVRGASRMASEAARVTPAIVKSLERYFGQPYPFKKLDLIAAPEFLFGAMENPGAIVFADRRLLIDPSAMSPNQRRSMMGVIAHELAHMWFGDLVTMAWWDDLWLNESFADWMATKVMDDVAPEFHSGTTTLFGIQRALTTDSRPSTWPVRAPVSQVQGLPRSATELTYNKGEAVLTMLEGWVGVPTFRQGVLEYLKAHAWGNATADDLWQALGKVSGERIDLAMETFLNQAGTPLVTLRPESAGRVRLSQKRLLIGNTAPKSRSSLWRVPITLRYPDAGALKTRRVWLLAADTVIDLGTRSTPDWIEPNANAAGYYRWNVPDAMLESLVAARTRLEPRERIELAANLMAQLQGGLVHGDRFLALESRLADDPAPEVVRATIDALNEVRVPLVTPRADAAFASYLRETFHPALDRWGMSPPPGDPVGDALVRPLVLRMLADGGRDPAVLDFAASLRREYGKDPSSVPASLLETGIVVGALRGDRAEFEEDRRRFETTNVPIERQYFLGALGTFRDPALRAEALDYALRGPLRPHEVLTIPGAMALNPLGVEYTVTRFNDDEVAKWMMQHFRELSQRMPPDFQPRVLALGAGCTEERASALRAFAADSSKHVRGGTAAIERLMDGIDQCAELRRREASRVERWLLEHAVTTNGGSRTVAAPAAK